MELTWIAIIASVCMGIGGVLIFVFAVKRNYFKDLEDAKYQMFWSEVEQLVESGTRDSGNKERKNGDSKASKAS